MDGSRSTVRPLASALMLCDVQDMTVAVLCFFLFRLVFQFVHSVQIVGHAFFGSREQARIHHKRLAWKRSSVHLPWAEWIPWRQRRSSLLLLGLRSEVQSMEARHTSRMQLIENEVVIWQGKIKDKDANGGRDLFNVKKAFGSLPLFDGRVDKYGDWRFKVITVFEMEDNFRELLEWTEKLTKMPEQEDLDEWEFEQKKKTGTLP